MLKVIGIGDNVCDKYEHLGLMFPGGQALNFSVYAKMLGADSSYLGVFGTDTVASHVKETLKEFGIEYGRCRQYDGENGYARVTLADGDRIFLGSNKGGVARTHSIELEQDDLNYIKTFALIHTSNNSYMNRQLSKLYKTGVPLSYDFSGQWKDEKLVEEVAPWTSYAFLSCGSVSEKEGEDICIHMKQKNCGFVVATRGSEGSLAFDGKEFFHQPPHLVRAVDTLGAGDSFATAFLLNLTGSYLKNSNKMEKNREFYQWSVKAAMEAGAEFAARTCLIQGAFGHGKSFI